MDSFIGNVLCFIFCNIQMSFRYGIVGHSTYIMPSNTKHNTDSCYRMSPEVNILPYYRCMRQFLFVVPILRAYERLCVWVY